jgi:hypothetical protein
MESSFPRRRPKDRSDARRIPSCSTIQVGRRFSRLCHELFAQSERAGFRRCEAAERYYGCSDGQASVCTRSHLVSLLSPVRARVARALACLVLILRKELIEAEKQLPPSEMILRVLPFDPMQRLTYNVLAALIAANVYTSESLLAHTARNSAHMSADWIQVTSKTGITFSTRRTKKNLTKSSVISTWPLPGMPAHTWTPKDA